MGNGFIAVHSAIDVIGNTVNFCFVSSNIKCMVYQIFNFERYYCTLFIF